MENKCRSCQELRAELEKANERWHNQEMRLQAQESRAEKAESEVSSLRAELAEHERKEVRYLDVTHKQDLEIASLRAAVKEARANGMMDAATIVYDWTHAKRVGGADIDLVAVIHAASVSKTKDDEGGEGA